MTAESQKNERYNARAAEARWQKTWAERGIFATKNDDPRPEILRAGDVPLPVGAHPHGPRAQLHHGRRGGALQTRHGQRRAAPDGLGRLRHAGGERRHRPQGAPQGLDLRQHRVDEEAAAVDGAVARLGARDRHLRPGLLQAPAEDVPRLPQGGAGRARIPQGELGPGRPDRARQRAGDRRPRLALAAPRSSSATSTSGCSRSATIRRSCSRRSTRSTAGRTRSS